MKPALRNMYVLIDVYKLTSASTRGVAQVFLQLIQKSCMVAELRYGLRVERS